MLTDSRGDGGGHWDGEGFWSTARREKEDAREKDV